MAKGKGKKEKESKQQIEVVMLDQLLEQGFATVPKALVRCGKSLTLQERMVWVVIYSYKGTHGIFPSQESLATDCGVSVESIKKYIKELKSKGFLISDRMGFAGNNRYTLCVPKSVYDAFENDMLKHRSLAIQEVVKETGFNLTQAQRKAIKDKFKKLGTGFALNDKMIDKIIVASETYENVTPIQYILRLMDSKVKYTGKAKQKDSVLKSFCVFFKQFERVPNEQELQTMDTALAEASPKNVVDAIKVMKKQNRTILEKEFNETVEKLKQIAQATSQAIAKSTYEIQNGVDLSKTQETNKTQKTAQKTNGAGSITNFSNLLPKKGGN